MKIVTVVKTRLDKYQLIAWHDQSEFKNREITITSEKGTEHIPIEDDCILCDFCNQGIDEFPIPVFHGHALCVKCYNEDLLGKTYKEGDKYIK